MPPQAGSLVRKAAQSLKESHSSLGDVSRELLAIQTDMGITEQTLFGKVVDEETAQDLVDQQQLVVAGNARARADVADLRTKLSDLAALLTTAQSEKNHWQTVAATLRAAIARNSEETIQHDKLLETEKLLKAAGTTATDEAAKVMSHVNSVHQLVQAEIAKQQELRDQIAKASTTARLCYSEEELLGKEVEKDKKLLPQENAAAKATNQAHEAALNATTQRFQAEVMILTSQVVDAEKAGQTAFKALEFAQTQLRNLEKRLTFDVHDTNDQIDKANKNLKDLGSQIAMTEGAVKAGAARKGLMDKQIVKLQEEISPIETATMEAENEALQNELNQALALLARSKAAEAVAVATSIEQQAKVSAYKQAALLAAQSVVVARQQSQEELEAAVQMAEATKRSSTENVQRANAAIEEKCRAKWADRAAENNRAVDSCRAMKQDLEAVRAQQLTLEQTLQSQTLARESQRVPA